MGSGLLDLLRAIDSAKVDFFGQLGAVAEIMTRTVRTLTLDHKLKDAVKLFQEAKIYHAPVIDPDKKDVIGIVSDRDVCRVKPRYLGKVGQADGDQRIMETDIASIMTRNPVHIRATCPVVDALGMLVEKHIDCLLVYDEPLRLEGILTTRDFLKTVLLYFRVCGSRATGSRERLRLIDLAAGLSVDEVFQRGAHTVADLMSQKVVTLKEDSSVQDAITLMQTNRVRHLPIVVVVEEGSQRLVNLVSDRDILRALGPAKAGAARGHDHEGVFREKLFAADEKDPSLREKIAFLYCKRDVITVTPTTPLVEAVTTLIDKNINSLPVVDSKGCLRGMMTSFDVLLAMLAALRLGRKGQPAELSVR